MTNWTRQRFFYYKNNSMHPVTIQSPVIWPQCVSVSPALKPLVTCINKQIYWFYLIHTRAYFSVISSLFAHIPWSLMTPPFHPDSFLHPRLHSFIMIEKKFPIQPSAPLVMSSLYQTGSWRHFRQCVQNFLAGINFWTQPYSIVLLYYIRLMSSKRRKCLLSLTSIFNRLKALSKALGWFASLFITYI